jgi:peroxiredoxin
MRVVRRTTRADAAQPQREWFSKERIMAAQSLMLDLGTPAPDFSLPDTEGNTTALADFAQSKALLVAFLCNHCPFVKHILPAFVDFARTYLPKGLAVVAVSVNDVKAYPDDAPAKMADLARSLDFSFPYLYDETQDSALAYKAMCTPDFFLFDSARKLAYRGQFDSSSPGRSIPVTGADMRVAADAVLAGRPAPADQRPSIGCSIKWKPGKAPTWA